MRGSRTVVAGLAVAMGMAAPGVAETCTTQSAMTAAQRDALVEAAKGLATKIQVDDVAGVKALTASDLAGDFSAVQQVVGDTSAKVREGSLEVEQVYLLDATGLKKNSDGSAPDAQFYCTLNGTMAEVDFLIPGLPPGMYGFAIVDSKSATSPWRLSFLLRQEGGRWMMAGFYPKPRLAAGHDGLWYWTQARQMAARSEPWNAWLYYLEAEELLQPAGFVQSTHLEKLRAERTAVVPPVLSGGISKEVPLVVKGADGTEYRFTGLGVDDSLGKDKIDVTAHLKVDQMGDADAVRTRNAGAASALVGAYPQLRKAFHGVWIFDETPGQAPFAAEQPMNEVK